MRVVLGVQPVCTATWLYACDGFGRHRGVHDKPLCMTCDELNARAHVCVACMLHTWHVCRCTKRTSQQAVLSIRGQQALDVLQGSRAYGSLRVYYVFQ